MIRLDKVKSTAHLVNIIAEVNLNNGMVVALGALKADGEGYAVAAPAALTDRIVLHASVPMGYVEPDLEENFILKAGEVGRGYILEKGDIVTITDDMFVAAPDLGDVVEPVVAGFKLEVNATPTAAVQLKVIAKESLAARPASVLEVL